MAKTSILIIGTADTTGGAAQQSWELGHELKARGYDVKWLVRTKRSNKKYVQGFFNNWKTNFFHLKNFLFSNDINSGLEKEIFNHPWYKNADIIHLQNLHGNYFKLKTIIEISQEKKLFWTLHDMWAITGSSPYLLENRENHWLYPPMLFDTHKQLLSSKDKIYHQLKNLTLVTPSKWLNNLIKQSSLKKFSNKIIYNGVDIAKFKPTKNNPKNIITAIISGGFQSPYKGGNILKQLLPLLENLNLELHFIGSNKRKKINNIVYHGKLNQKELIKQYQSSKAILVPSLADNCPMVVIEAMSCGVPIVATKVGGIPELINHKKNGFLSEPTTESLLEGINWILKLTNEELNQIKLSNRNKAIKNFSLTKMVDQYEQLYHSL